MNPRSSFVAALLAVLGSAPLPAQIPDGATVVASSPNATNPVRIVRRHEDGSWRTAGFQPLPRAHDVARHARTPFAWLRGSGPGWRLLSGTSRGVVEFAYENDEIEHVGGFLGTHIVTHLAVAPDEALVAVDLGEEGIRLVQRDGSEWRGRAEVAFTVPVAHLSFARPDRLLVTHAEEVRIYDPDGELLGILPRIDAAGLLSAHALADGDKVVTLSAEGVLREWWLEEERVLQEARRSQ